MGSRSVTQSGSGSSLDMVLAMWHRRKWLVLFVFTTLFSAAVVLARSLPDIYEATASVLVEQPQVPERFVSSSVTAGLETRLQTITQEILSRARLNDLITQLGLFADVEPMATPQMLANRMRADVRVVTTEVRQPSGQQATIAFAVSYRGRDPQTVARVTNAIAQAYVERNATIREQQTSGTLQLLQAQLDDLRRKLGQRERELADFKTRHAGELPEQQAANLAALERLNAQLRLNIDRQLRVMERRDELGGDLANASVSQRVPPPVDEISAQIATLRAELANLRTQFTEEHPDVIRVQSQIAALEAQRPRVPQTAAEVATTETRRLQDAVRRAESELAALSEEERALRATITYHERRIENAPRQEQELQRVAGDYEAMRESYRALLQRYQDAQMAERVEHRQQGEQFRILDPAVPPGQPVAPNRFTMLLMGVMLAGAAGAGVGILAEARDTSFHTVDDLRGFTTVPVLASIPVITTQTDTRQQRMRFWLSAAAAAGCIAAAARAASHVAQGNEMLVRLLTPGRF